VTTTEHELLTITEAASIVRAPVANLRYRGTGPRKFRLGLRVVYRLADVQEWINVQGGDHPAATRRSRYLRSQLLDYIPYAQPFSALRQS
jgi:predicted DNA-binding transcriptional regulator AlpA